LTGSGGQRANQVLADPFVANKSREQYLNQSAFVIPDLGTYGTMGYNSLRGPHRTTIDMGIVRTFNIREGQTIQFRMEAFNVPNITNLNNPVSGRNSVNFGRIQGSGDPRIMQAALKYVF
jgi:hypothetical protein